MIPSQWRHNLSKTAHTMKKEDKAIVIEKIAKTIKEYSCFYLVETAGLNAEKTSALRRACFGKEVKLFLTFNTFCNSKHSKLLRHSYG